MCRYEPIISKAISNLFVDVKFKKGERRLKFKYQEALPLMKGIGAAVLSMLTRYRHIMFVQAQELPNINTPGGEITFNDCADPYNQKMPSSDLQVSSLEFEIVDKYGDDDDPNCKYDTICKNIDMKDFKMADGKAVFYTELGKKAAGTGSLKIERSTADALREFMNQISQKRGENGFMVMEHTHMGPCILCKRNGNILEALGIELREGKYCLRASASNGKNECIIVYAHCIVNQNTKIKVCPMDMLGLSDADKKTLKDSMNIEIMTGAHQPEEKNGVNEFLDSIVDGITTTINDSNAEETKGSIDESSDATFSSEPDVANVYD
ncbi:uncharacterized protein VICG_01671 [Vittaforma corneae ATCC 50505]|uniref:Uncharacterized protein n=1 Tax=Vittaforma corneae (strain ATCC 50505) TaxID=993615 RepID=L2GK90_VITCO|nr:uncharacterized protein VICG_01671 [Vittaforma corneae ATCC 50505]ELA41298.1 hypothetical protein VICG_01671 [Vittaforma corneae ATCC 50505]